MERKVKEAIERYQCSGCTVGGDTSCFEEQNSGVGCARHLAGTFIYPIIGGIFLGMPKGFNRIGNDSSLKPHIYASYESSDWSYDKWNIPVWKYLSPDGHTFVRGMIPRINATFIHVFLENCIDRIDCLEVTNEDIDYMD